MISAQLKAVAVSLAGVAALCVLTSNNGITTTLEKANKASKKEEGSSSSNLEALIQEAEGSNDSMQGLISSVHTIATLKAQGQHDHPLISRAHAVRQSALGSLGYS